MAWEQEGHRFTAPAGANFGSPIMPPPGISPLGAGQYRAMTLTAEGELLLCDGSTQFVGVLQDDPWLGEHGTVQFARISKAIAGAAINPGQPVVPGALGAFFPAASLSQLSAPAAPTVATIGTAGSTTYEYELVYQTAYGTTTPSAAGTVTTGNATLSATNANVLTWAAPPAGVINVVIYGRTSGSLLKMATVPADTLTWTDTGAVTPAGAVPGTNTSASTGPVAGVGFAAEGVSVAGGIFPLVLVPSIGTV